MKGDIHRLRRDFSDITFLQLLDDSDKGLLDHNLSPFFTRPVYAYTKAAVGGHMTWFIEHMKNS